MTLIEKTYHILLMKCKHSIFANKLTRNFSLNKNVLAYKKNNLQIMYLLKMMERYQVFDNKVYNAQEITFTRNLPGEVEITFTLDGDTFTYTGSGDNEDINYYFANLINLNLGKYIAYANNGSLFIYTYYNLETFDDVPTITITNTDVTETQILLEYSINSLEDNLEKLLNLWNCITLEDFCKIENKIKNLTSC